MNPSKKPHHIDQTSGSEREFMAYRSVEGFCSSRGQCKPNGILKETATNKLNIVIGVLEAGDENIPLTFGVVREEKGKGNLVKA
jgi:hypothetical protein